MRNQRDFAIYAHAAKAKMTNDLQLELFDLIRDRLDQGSSIAEELMELLQVSSDSVYRRLRGETLLTFPEVARICQHFGISIDSLLNISTDEILFTQRWNDASVFSYSEYLNTHLNDLSTFRLLGNPTLYIQAGDLPDYYFFTAPELAAFRAFFIGRTTLQLKEFKSRKFDLDKTYEHHRALEREIFRQYLRIPSMEIWSRGLLDNLTAQLVFTAKSNYFRSPYMFFQLCDKLEQLTAKMQQMAETGVKTFLSGDIKSKGKLQVYVNDFLHGDGTIIAKAGEKYATVVKHQEVGQLLSTNQQYGKRSWEVHERIANRSNLITGMPGEYFDRFFHELYARIDWARLQMS